MSSVPAPQPNGAPQVTPALVPHTPPPPRRRPMLVAGIAALVAAIGGLAYYLNTGPKGKVPGPPDGTSVVRTSAVDVGDIHATVRVNGTISAERFAAIMAPQVRGSRNDRGRGVPAASTNAPNITVQSVKTSTGTSGTSQASTNRFKDTGSSSSGSSSGGSSGSSSSSGSSGSSSSSSGGDSGSSGGGGSSSGGGGGGGGGRMGRMSGGMSDFMLVLQSLAKGGSYVHKGDVIAEFDRQYQQMRRDDYTDSVNQMDANIKKMKADLAVTMEIQQQKTRAAKANWEKAEFDLKTIEVRSAIDTEKFKLAVEETKAQYQELVKESALLVESQRAQIRATEIDRDQAKIELQRAVANVEKLIMKAPMDGIVVMQSIFRGGEFGQIQVGDQIASGQMFMTIVDPSSMVLNGTVNQVDAEKLRMGAKAFVRLDAYPDVELPGTVIGIGAMAKTSNFRASYVGEIPVRLKLDRTESRVIPDLTASAEIVLHTEKDALITPRAAVFQENGAAFVFLRGPEGWIRKDVELGVGNHVAVAVRSGLRKGDVVALQRPI